MVADPPESEEKELDAERPTSERGGAENVLAMHEPIARENEEPADGYEPLPTWLVFLFFGLVGWGGWYLGTLSAGFRPDVFHIEEALAARVPEKAVTAPPDVSRTGQLVYQQRCAACHQSDGQGLAGAFPPLAGASYVVGDPARLVRILLDGLQGPITVKGQTYSGAMPAWEAQLDDAEIAAVASYVRSHFGNDASAISEAFVLKMRELSASRTTPWTVEELERAEPVEAGDGGDGQ